MDGWTLLFKTIEKVIKTKSDVLIAFVHWQLLHAGMRCLGIGDDRTLSDLDEESEILPDGWNVNKSSYKLRYKYDNDVFVLMGTVIDGKSMMLNLLNGKSLEVSNALFVLDPTVVSLKGKLVTLIPKFESVITRLQHELFDPVFSANKKSLETQNSQSSQPHPSNIWMSPIPYTYLSNGSPWPPKDFLSNGIANAPSRSIYNYPNFGPPSNFLPVGMQTQDWVYSMNPQMRIVPIVPPGLQFSPNPPGLWGDMALAATAPTFFNPTYPAESEYFDGQRRNRLP